MTAAEFHASILVPGLAWFATICPGVPVNRDVVVLMLATAGVESGWQDVPQADGGPGRSFFQFEPETCYDVLHNRATDVRAIKVCVALHIQPNSVAVYADLIGNTRLSVGFARLDYWANPAPIPHAEDAGAQYKYYLDTWQPGAPSPARWNVCRSVSSTQVESPGSYW